MACKSLSWFDGGRSWLDEVAERDPDLRCQELALQCRATFGKQLSQSTPASALLGEGDALSLRQPAVHLRGL